MIELIITLGIFGTGVYGLFKMGNGMDKVRESGLY